MAVCMSRRIGVDLYNEIIKRRPHWHSDDDASGAVKVVMTGAASDPPALAHTSATSGGVICWRNVRVIPVTRLDW